MAKQYIEIAEDGTKFYFKDKDMDLLHREDGPAVEVAGRPDKNEWYVNGKYMTKEEFENKIEDRNIKDRNLKLFAMGVLNILANHEEWNADVVDKIVDSSVDFGVANFTADGNFNVL